MPSNPSDYKALVCVFLLGGNDGHTLLVPLRGAARANYLAARGSLALPDGKTPVLPIAAKNGTPCGLNAGHGGAASALGPGQTRVRPEHGDAREADDAGAVSRGDGGAADESLFAPGPARGDAGRRSLRLRRFGAGGALGECDARDECGVPVSVGDFLCRFVALLFGQDRAVDEPDPGFNLAGDGMGAWPASAVAAKAKAREEIVSFNSGLSLVQAANDVRADGTELNGLLNGLGNSSVATVFPVTNIG